METKHYIKKEYPNLSSLPLVGEDNIFYETTNDGNIYRWDNFNTSYFQIGTISGVTGGMVISALGFTPYDAVNPSGYIDITALAPYQTVLGYTPEDVTNKDIDGTLSANSDTLYASQKAVKTYIDASVTGVLDDRGNWDASGNVFPTTGGSGVGGAILKGDLWFVSVAGTLGGTSVVVGNNFRALVDNPTLTTDWNILNVGLGYIAENIANKGVANGYASLDSNAKITASQLEYKTLHTHGFNNSIIGSTSGQRWVTFGALTMVGNAASYTSNPSYSLAQRLGVIPKTGFIKSVKISWYITGGTSTQNHILTFRNNTTSTTYTVTTTLQIGPASGGTAKTYVVSSLNIPVTENDVVHSAIESPTISGTVLNGVYMVIDYIIE